MATFTTRHVRMKDVRFEQTSYADGTPALIAEDRASGDRSVLSVNLAAYDAYPPEGHIFVRAYGRHEGVVDELERLGVGKRVAEVNIGWATDWLVKLDENSDLLDEWHGR